MLLRVDHKEDKFRNELIITIIIIIIIIIAILLHEIIRLRVWDIREILDWEKHLHKQVMTMQHNKAFALKNHCGNVIIFKRDDLL